ncbi:MAG: autotransporter-associated beta strand repeat-containing protein [Opitutales bacterium]|nr:autotransporter-associated beta strand repeat-containing protein [Opitutales bacterium]
MNSSKFFLSTLIAAAAMTATAYAEEPTVEWSGPAFKWDDTNKNWITGTWNSETKSFVWTDTTSTSPGRANNKGPVYYFGDTETGLKELTFSGQGGIDTSDGGGIVVTGTGNTVNISAGRWAGSIQVDVGNILNTSWSAQLKDGTIVANGIVNITSGNLNLDGAGQRIWWVGSEGAINFSTATGLSTGTVVVSGAVDTTGEAEIEGLLNRSRGFAVKSKDMVTFAAGLTSGLESLSVGTIDSSVADTSLSVVESYDSFSAANQYYVDKSAKGVRVYYTIEDYTAMDLIWAGTSDNSTWTDQGSNWSSSGTETSFLNGDNVTFDGTGNGTVSLENGADISVGNMVVSGGTYKLSIGTTSNGYSARISGKTLSVEAGAQLNIGETKWTTLGVAFDDISVAGTLVFNTNAGDSWSSLTLKEGGLFKIEDSQSAINVGTLNVEGSSKINFTWDKTLNLGALSGAGDLAITGSGNWAASVVSIKTLKDYTGTLTLDKGNNGLNFSISGTGNYNAGSYTEELGNENLKIVVNEGMTLALTSAMSKFTYNTLTMKNDSTMTFNNGNNWGSRDITGILDVDADGGRVTIKGGTNGNTSNIAGEITGVGTVSFEQINGGGNNYSVSANITDKSATEKLSVNVGLSASLTLSGNNTYSGGTTISSGKLVAANANALGTSSVTISGGQLEVSGTDVTVSNNITVVLGDTLENPVILGDGSLGGKITLNYAASAENAALMIATETTTKTYTLLSGNVGANLTEADFAVGTGWADGWSISDYAYNSETGIGTLTMTIPEPSAFGLLAGVGALALVVSRRKRRK